MSTVNTTLGTWSELFMLMAALVYMFVFIAFAWDMASHSKTLREAERREQRSEDRAEALVGAGSRAGGAAGSAAAPGEGAAQDWATSSRDDRNDAGSGSRAGWRSNGAKALEGQVADSSMAYADNDHRRPAARIAVVLMVLAFAIHLAAVIMRAIAANRVPWSNMYEFSTTGALLIVAVYLVMLAIKDLRFVGVLISGLVTLMLTAATIAYPTPVSPLQPALQSYWLVIHVSIAVAAMGIFAITFAMAILQLVQDRREKRILEGGPSGWAFLKIVPSAQTLENFSYRLNSVGFVFWTFTLAAGAIWARDAWGRYWGWDPKEVWTFVIWVVYAAYLHARATRGWTGRRSAWLSIVGFVCILFNYFVVNTVFDGLHSYSGL
ncbi:c-type cytochrome biogenesis protein CcsB [Kocuria sp.]|uniref:c-type cytochrome biogenesis protein CcsB n=1 Tax=Kocuria sp. TaxID=1871328 RepID=UPI0026E0CA4B|nr:c-type cytochrome biogenesis protein CcsB [Kocuria sp.]MDO5617490.1 c-type cytochrome biogenesis protein CcsB [Kocuria sp.]